MPDDDSNTPDGDVGTTAASSPTVVREMYRDPNTESELRRARAEAKAYREERDRYRSELEFSRRETTEKAKEIDGLRGRMKQFSEELEAARAERKRVEEELTADRLRAEGELKASHDAALAQLRDESNRRLTVAEVKAEAIRAGMVDPDGLKLLDLSGAQLNDDGTVKLPDGFFDKAKEAKPWLFGSPQPASSTTTQPPPPVEPPRVKRATEMTAQEVEELERRIIATGRAA
jgi:hypothetical protein